MPGDLIPPVLVARMIEMPVFAFRLMTREEAAEWCRLSPNHFDQTVGKEVPPVAGLGRRRIWDRKAIELWLDSQLQRTDAAPHRAEEDALIEGAKRWGRSR